MDPFRRLAIPITAAFFAITVHAVRGEDWPQWRGPRQDGISRETGLLAEWPEKGPAELWRVPLGNGFSAVSVVGDRAFTLYGTSEGEFAAAFRVADGKTLWKTPLSELLTNGSYGDGPRATPAVELGPGLCLERQGGLAMSRCSRWPRELGLRSPEDIWRQAARIRFRGVAGRDGRCARRGRGRRPGQVARGFRQGQRQRAVTALDDKIGYSTPCEVTIDGVSQIIVLMGEALVSVSPQDGKEYWRQDWKTELNANVATPVISGNRMFISTGYSTGSASSSFPPRTASRRPRSFGRARR